MPDHTLAGGDRVGEYVLDEKIGGGGFGSVWKAHHAHLSEKVVAIKIPNHPDTIELLRREGTIQHSLDSPSIVQTIGLDLDHDPPYLVMEFVDGEDLRKRVDRSAPIGADEAIRLCREILEPLRLAHGQGIVHRDLKPGNVLLPRGGGVKLTDFGLGKVVDASRSALIRSQAMESAEIAPVVGTLAYMSPEQKSGEGPVDERTDLFAFGVLFFEMLTGELPVGSELPSDLVKGLDKGLDEIYRKACARLESRYVSAAEVLKDLGELGRRRASPDPSAEPAQRSRTAWPLRGGWILVAAVLSLGLLLGYRLGPVGPVAALVLGIAMATAVVFSLGVFGQRGEEIEKQLGNMIIFALVVAAIFLILVLVVR